MPVRRRMSKNAKVSMVFGGVGWNTKSDVKNKIKKASVLLFSKEEIKCKRNIFTRIIRKPTFNNIPGYFTHFFFFLFWMLNTKKYSDYMFLCVYCSVEVNRFSPWNRKGLGSIELRCNILLTDGRLLIIVRTTRQIQNYIRKG